MQTDSFIFGIYAGGVAGTPSGLTEAKRDDAGSINERLTELQGARESFLVRGYLHFKGDSQIAAGEDLFSQTLTDFCHHGRKLDLVLCFRHTGSDLENWFAFIANALSLYGPHLNSLQITEEANLSFGGGAIDGDYPHVLSALIRGVAFAKSEVKRQALAVEIGFSVAPSLGPHQDFWTKLRAQSTVDFLDSLDYVGLDFFPDVFWAIDPNDLRPSIIAQLKSFRETSLASAAIPDFVPIRITENGWPTGADRSEARQAETLATIVNTIYEHRRQFNLTHYQWFSLRDADSGVDDKFHQFGLLRDDYSPKPAFSVYQTLIGALRG